MKRIFIIAQHRNGRILDGTYESIAAAFELNKTARADVAAVLLGHNVARMAEQLAVKCPNVHVAEHPALEHFNSESYCQVLASHLKEQSPCAILLPHNSFGIDLAPALAVGLDLPLLSDCIELEGDDAHLRAVSQLYSNKINVTLECDSGKGAIATLRPGAFPYENLPEVNGGLTEIRVQLEEDSLRKKFVAYKEAVTGEVDISQAEVIVAVGRGIAEQEALPMIDSLARALGGVVACSRPVVDKRWLPSYRQVGISGFTVKPKIYFAVGISGAFQHLAGIQGNPVIIAINNDPDAPIFRKARYGIVDDLKKVVPLLEQKIREIPG